MSRIEYVHLRNLDVRMHLVDVVFCQVENEAEAGAETEAETEPETETERAAEAEAEAEAEAKEAPTGSCPEA